MDVNNNALKVSIFILLAKLNTITVGVLTYYMPPIKLKDGEQAHTC